MSRDIVWILKPVALQSHEEQLRLHGGEGGILNEGRLDAALDRPRTALGYAPNTSLEDLAALMAVGIAKGHPFVDGNKRTACVCAVLFLSFNGVELSATDDELAAVFELVAAGKMLEEHLARWFIENTMPPE